MTMTHKKLFVVLEQGNNCNTHLSIEHKAQFDNDYCDWFRLNWKADTNDTYAHFFKNNIVWTEGRSLLYDMVKGKYEYYIFIDDDVQFISTTNNSVCEEIKLFLENFKPLSGTFYGDNWAWNLYNKEIVNSNKQVFPIMCYDLCCHIFQHDFADKMFPVFFHGSGKSMWYAQFIAFKLFPQKCLVYKNIIIKNTEHVPHQDHTNSQFNSGNELVLAFSNKLKDKSHKEEFLSWNNDLYRLLSNKNVFESSISLEKVNFTNEELNQLI